MTRVLDDGCEIHQAWGLNRGETQFLPLEVQDLSYPIINKEASYYRWNEEADIHLTDARKY